MQKLLSSKWVCKYPVIFHTSKQTGQKSVAQKTARSFNLVPCQHGGVCIVTYNNNRENAYIKALFVISAKMNLLQDYGMESRESVLDK